MNKVQEIINGIPKIKIIKCDRVGCVENATAVGHVYGHVKGSDDKDSLIKVHACDKHRDTDGFFLEKELYKFEGV